MQHLCFFFQVADQSFLLTFTRQLTVKTLKHLLNHIPQPQGFPYRISQRKRRSIQRALIQITGRCAVLFRLRFGDKTLTQPCHRLHQCQHQHTADQVIDHMEINNDFRRRQIVLADPERQRFHPRQHQHTANQFEQHTAEHHLTRNRILTAAAQHGQEAAAEVRADDDRQTDMQRHQAGGTQCGRQQHRRQAGVADHGEQCAHQQRQHRIPAQ